jgi:hypothetical protein
MKKKFLITSAIAVSAIVAGYSTYSNAGTDALYTVDASS